MVLFLSHVFGLLDSVSNTYFTSLLEKAQFSKEGQKSSSFCCHNNGIKKKKKRQKLPTIGGTKNSTQKYNSTKSNKIGAEVQLFTACPSFAATSVTELQTPKHAAYGVRADPVRGPLAALDDLCHSGNARIHTKNKTEIKPQ